MAVMEAKYQPRRSLEENGGGRFTNSSKVRRS